MTMSANASQKERVPSSSAKSGSKGHEICLRLYIASTTPNSERAKINLAAALEEFTVLAGCNIEYIDVLADAKRAVAVALGPKRRLVMIGDLSDSNKLQGLLKAAASLG
jgi:hypothetical protein